MRNFPKVVIAVCFLVCCFVARTSRALSMSELQQMNDLTPEKFGRLFAGFAFKFHEEVQPHNVFLKSQSGDCDDYATVAAEVLARRGYTPRMIAVRMKGETHVICYIQETHSYLDYNMRKEQNPMVPCSEKITEIAKKVSASFGRDWIATYEFTYEEKESTKRLVNAIIPNRDAEKAVALSNKSAHIGATKSPKQK